MRSFTFTFDDIYLTKDKSGVCYSGSVDIQFEVHKDEEGQFVEFEPYSQMIVHAFFDDEFVCLEKDYIVIKTGKGQHPLYQKLLEILRDDIESACFDEHFSS